MDQMGKALVLLGAAAAGAFLWLVGRHHPGGLPGDIVLERRNVRVYFPLMTCLLVSAALSLFAWLLRR